ncbi:MAG: hypothetical protein M1812_002626 [Candelaria pacifica]|nr:MAG: hypothetical protein M1812_002626 [Candelaria pacifica]
MANPNTDGNGSRPPSPGSPTSPTTRNRGSSGSGRLRSASLRFQDSSPPLGFLHATGSIAAKAPTLSEIRRGSYDHDGWNEAGQLERRNSGFSDDSGNRRLSRTNSAQSPGSPAPKGPGGQSYIEGGIAETADEHEVHAEPKSRAQDQVRGSPVTSHQDNTPYMTENGLVYPNGYKPPPKHTWGQATVIGLKGFWKFFITPLGFLVTIYGLNVVAWGGMLFLLLIGGGKAMCHPTCNDIESPRRKWIEVDSQILNALFCVTGFGLIPWRFRDLYYLLQFRISKKQAGLRKLAGINRGWFRLEGSDRLESRDGTTEAAISPEKDTAIPLPVSKTPDPPLTGVRAPPTKMWKLDFVIWAYVLNTFLQAVLSGFMWGYNRYKRPSWSTGTFVALACIVAGAGGYMAFNEGKHVKKIEGVPVDEAEALKDIEKSVGKNSGKSNVVSGS